MRKLLSLTAAVATLAFASTLVAEELKSGLQEGETIGAFIVEKCAGNPEDGVPVGENLCYRCMLGNRPTVAVFAKDADENLASLVKQLDAVVAKHQDKKMASFVTLDVNDMVTGKAKSEKLVKESEAKNVAVVVPTKQRVGIDGLKLNDKAAVTVLIFKDGKIASNHAYAEAKLLDKEAIATIIKDTAKVVN
ncbi:MAG: hypothetical protein WDZ59_17500 [Pirellulales bacterium]